MEGQATSPGAGGASQSKFTRFKGRLSPPQLCALLEVPLLTELASLSALPGLQEGSVRPDNAVYQHAVGP